MKSLRVIFILCLISSTAFSQSFAELENRKGDNSFITNWIHIMARHTSISPKYTESYSGFTANMSFHINHYEAGELRYDFENSTLGDMIYLVLNIKEMDGRPTEQAFGSGFLGWHQSYINVVATKRFLLSPGLSFGDYIFASKRADDSQGARILDPAGYFLHVGPALKSSYVLTSNMWLDAFATYDIAFQVGKPSAEYKSTKDYPRPAFLNIGAKIHHAKFRLFGGARITQLIDNGENNDSATRLDISLGYMFGNR